MGIYDVKIGFWILTTIFTKTVKKKIKQAGKLNCLLALFTLLAAAPPLGQLTWPLITQLVPTLAFAAFRNIILLIN
jgi:hypothetical protein